MTERRALALGLAALVPVVLLVYAGLYDGWFLRDDFMWLRDAQRQWDEPSRFWTTRPSGYFRPVANLFFGLEYALFGLTATGYLVVNVLLHLANVCLLALLLAALGAPLRAVLPAAAFAGLAVTAVPGVVWISDIVSLLAMAFLLGALLCYRRFLLDGHLRDGALAVLCVALAAGSRESGVLAGVGIVLLELHHGGWRTVTRRAFWLRMAPYALLAAAYLAAQTDLTRFDAVQRQDEAGVLAPFLWSWLANLPALVSWHEGGQSVSYRDGLLVLVGYVAALGLLGRRRGLVVAAWVVGLGVLAMAPYLLQLAAGPTLAGRYRYEAVLVAAAGVGALFAYGWGGAGPRGLTLVRRGASLALLSVLLGLHLGATRAWLEEDERFMVYADQTHAFARQLDALLDSTCESPDLWAHGDPVLVLAGVPVENERHLWDQLVVFHGWPVDQRERVESVILELNEPAVAGSLQAAPAKYLTAVAAEVGLAGGDHLAYVWSRPTERLVPAGSARRVLGKLQYDWRRPLGQANRGHLRLLHLTPEVRAALRAHTGPFDPPRP